MLHPAIGQYLNNTDSGKVEQWDGFKWQTIGPSGNPKNTPTPDPEALDAALARAAGITTEGHGGGSYVSGGAPLYSGGTPAGGGIVAPPTAIIGGAPSRPGPSGQGQGGQGQSGGRPLACTFVAPLVVPPAPMPQFSSLDIFGGKYGYTTGPLFGYTKAGSVYPFAHTITDPGGYDGNYAVTLGYAPPGMNAGSPGTPGWEGPVAGVPITTRNVAVRWVWDLASLGPLMPMCTVRLTWHDIDGALSVWASHDGTTWVPMKVQADFPPGGGSLPLSGSPIYRFWSVLWTAHVVNLVYIGPTRIDSFELWRMA
jgi:hypothetical protein